MANATADLPLRTNGEEKRFTSILASNVKLYRGTMISQLTASGYAVPTTTALSGPAIGVMPCYVDGSLTSAGGTRIMLEQGIFRFANDGSNPVDEATPIGTPLFATDDHTVADAGTVYAGTFQGLESDGFVRVEVGAGITAIVAGIVNPV